MCWSSARARAGMYAAIEAARAGCDRAARRPQPDRARRRHRHGADDGRGRRSARKRPTIGSTISTTRSKAGRGLCDEAPRAPAVRGRPGLHPRRWTNGASAGRARTATSRRPSRPAMTGRAASMSISSTPARRCRRRCARVVNRIERIRKAGDLLRRRSRAHRRRGRRRGGAASADRRAGDDRRQGDDRRHRRADAALSPQQRLGQYGRRRLCAGACAPARRSSTWSSCSSSRSGIWRRG